VPGHGRPIGGERREGRGTRRAGSSRPTVGVGDHRVRDDAPETSDAASKIGGLLTLPTVIWAVVRGMQRGR